MIDRYLAWLNVNINVLDEQSKSKTGKSLLQRRKNRYKRDILIKAREVYKEVNA